MYQRLTVGTTILHLVEDGFATSLSFGFQGTLSSTSSTVQLRTSNLGLLCSLLNLSLVVTSGSFRKLSPLFCFSIISRKAHHITDADGALYLALSKAVGEALLEVRRHPPEKLQFS